MTDVLTTVFADSWGWHHGDVGVGWMMVGMLVFWGILVAALVWMMRGGTRRREETPQEILRRRLADGSLTLDEYEQRRTALDRAQAPTPPGPA